MSELMDNLYFYAQQNRVMDYLQGPEYRRAVFGLEEGWERFRTVLTREQNQQLDGLLAREREVGGLEDKASFLAGASIGLELGRL